MKLQDSVQSISGIGPKKAEDLAEISIETVSDLLQHVPFRYEDASVVKPIEELVVGELVTIEAEVTDISSFRIKKRIPMTRVEVVDEVGDTLTITFFHQAYVAKQLKVGESYAFTGKVGEWKGTPALTNPNYEPLEKEHRVHTGRVLPVYSQHKSITSVWLRRIMPNLLAHKEILPQEYLNPTLRETAHLTERPVAWKYIHIPETMDEANAARKRIAFDELWEIFDALQQEQAEREARSVRQHFSETDIQEFYAQFTKAIPFSLTPTQTQAIETIAQEFSRNVPFKHFVQGEVGSGKTLVAAFALMLASHQGGQGLYLVPTTVLAEQHFQSLQPIAQKLGLRIALWTGNRKDTPDANIVIGTHAFLHHTEKFTPDIVIIDEEHRFGVKQREHEWDLIHPPRIITMTATPIPRSLAHVLYGNHAVSFLEPIPGKERTITTRVFAPKKIDDHLAWLSDQVTESKQQAFIITPLIEPSETELFADVYDAQTTYKRVQQALPHLSIAILTGRTPAEEKHAILQKMHRGDIDILIATPVIEVGIDIPEASIITILSAERFGFAQLHQLRGRVGRKGQNGWCFLVPTPGKDAGRLRLLETTQDGHELAEIDLQNRGAGEFLGTRQTGWDGLKIATWMDLPLIELVKDLHSQQKSGTIRVQPKGSVQ